MMTGTPTCVGQVIRRLALHQHCERGVQQPEDEEDAERIRQQLWGELLRRPDREMEESERADDDLRDGDT